MEDGQNRQYADQCQRECGWALGEGMGLEEGDGRGSLVANLKSHSLVHIKDKLERYEYWWSGEQVNCSSICHPTHQKIILSLLSSQLCIYSRISRFNFILTVLIMLKHTVGRS
jgi:hypothetical protein